MLLSWNVIRTQQAECIHLYLVRKLVLAVEDESDVVRAPGHWHPDCLHRVAQSTLDQPGDNNDNISMRDLQAFIKINSTWIMTPDTISVGDQPAPVDENPLEVGWVEHGGPVTDTPDQSELVITGAWQIRGQSSPVYFHLTPVGVNHGRPQPLAGQGRLPD